MSYKEARELFKEQSKRSYTIMDYHLELSDFMFFCKELLQQDKITPTEYQMFTN